VCGTGKSEREGEGRKEGRKMGQKPCKAPLILHNVRKKETENLHQRTHHGIHMNPSYTHTHDFMSKK